MAEEEEERRLAVWTARGGAHKGAIAKTTEGKLGVVTCDPDEDDEVRLRFADETSAWIKAATLTQATASDAGYDALMQSWVVWCFLRAMAKTAEGRAGLPGAGRPAEEFGVPPMVARRSSWEGGSKVRL